MIDDDCRWCCQILVISVCIDEALSHMSYSPDNSADNICCVLCQSILHKTSCVSRRCCLPNQCLCYFFSNGGLITNFLDVLSCRNNKSTFWQEMRSVSDRAYSMNTGHPASWIWWGRNEWFENKGNRLVCVVQCGTGSGCCLFQIKHIKASTNTCKTL